MKIKLLPKKDLKLFWKIQKKYLDKWTYSYLEVQYNLFSNLYIGCYDNNNKLIGLAYGFPKRNMIILQGICVLHKQWRSGLGTKILKYFEKQVKKTGKKIVSVGSAEGFVEKFYLSNGYLPVELQVKDKNYIVLHKEKVKDYIQGNIIREKLRKKYKPKEIIYIMNKKVVKYINN